ncbi:hypothetical protein [Actinomadura craniellae]|uniref:hypothetical protein n=1 Tax=Actinomadura craniellae TaxID=2231787 RepID=UPI0011BD78E7|nr:hypothetical protein [Actinomadura craniellae]
MEARTLAEALNLIMEERRWTQAQLAGELGEGITQAWVSRASRGLKDATIGTAARMLSRVGWEIRIVPRAEGKTGRMKRRQFLGGVAGATGIAAIDAAVGPSLVAAAKTSPYDDPEYVASLANHVRQMRQNQGGADSIKAVVHHARHVISAVDNGNSELREPAAELVRVSALTLYDADYVDAAEDLAGKALKLAREAGDLESQANIYASLSQIAAYGGNADRGIRYARKGLSFGSDLTDYSRANLHIRLGRSLANIRGQDVTEIREVLEAGRNSSLSPVEALSISGNIGLALADLGDHEEAIEELDYAVHDINSMRAWGAEFLAREIPVMLDSGKLQLAAMRIIELAYAVPYINSARVDKYVREVLAKSASYSHVSEMREARELLRTVISEPRTM